MVETILSNQTSEVCRFACVLGQGYNCTTKVSEHIGGGGGNAPPTIILGGHMPPPPPPCSYSTVQYIQQRALLLIQVRMCNAHGGRY